MSSKKPFYFQASEITDKKYLDSKISSLVAMTIEDLTNLSG
jgi:hypothetical protein